MPTNVKVYVFICFLFSGIQNVLCQDQKVADSLSRIYIKDIVKGEARLELLRNLAFNEMNDLNLAIKYADELIKMSKQLENNLYLHRGYYLRGNKKLQQGYLEEALDALFKSGEFAKRANYTKGEGTTYASIANIYAASSNHHNARLYYGKAIATLRQLNDSIALASAILNSGDEFLSHKILDSAYLQFKEASIIFEKSNYLPGKAYSLGNIGMVFANTGQNNLAEKNINESIRILETLKDFYPICVYLISMCDIYLQKGDTQTAMNYAKRSLKLAKQYGLKEQIRDANLKLSELYESAGNIGESFKYYRDHITYRDSVYDIKSIQSLADLRTNFEVSKKQTEVDLLNQEKRNQGIIVGLLALLLSFIVYGYFQKQKANRILQGQKEEINQKSLLLEQSIAELRATQTQLIHKEKMASLGELTAGIAHEIQNPLNFVNNFSEVSAELVSELREEDTRVDRDVELIGELLDDLTQNLQKITHHGGRASAIVKGMLEHSRSGTGEKRPTDLNALADEYQKIAYRGFQARDKDFNAEIITNFGLDLGPVVVMPQEMGRVLLNLYNNAFYAVQQKQKKAPADYQPTVTVSTTQVKGHIQIRIGDNGTGIPESVKAKIFQPFFTTKPTGEGTGLGLSLSYDIVTKGHQGSLLVQSQEGEGSEFIIQLPTTNGSSLA